MIHGPIAGDGNASRSNEHPLGITVNFRTNTASHAFAAFPTPVLPIGANGTRARSGGTSWCCPKIYGLRFRMTHTLFLHRTRRSAPDPRNIVALNLHFVSQHPVYSRRIRDVTETRASPTFTTPSRHTNAYIFHKCSPHEGTLYYTVQLFIHNTLYILVVYTVQPNQSRNKQKLLLFAKHLPDIQMYMSPVNVLLTKVPCIFINCTRYNRIKLVQNKRFSTRFGIYIILNKRVRFHYNTLYVPAA